MRSVKRVIFTGYFEESDVDHGLRRNFSGKLRKQGAGNVAFLSQSQGYFEIILYRSQGYPGKRSHF